MTPQETQRLAFAKYLLEVGMSHLRQPEPLASAGLLALHDAAEFFLQLAVERFNVSKKDVTFTGYWTLLAAKFPDGRVPHHAAMERLNKARVALKHHGTMPSRLDLEGFGELVRRFFDECTPVVFGVTVDSISLIDFVACARARKELEAAQSALERGDLRSGLEACALAFDSLIMDYEKRKRGKAFRSPFSFGSEVIPLGLSRLTHFPDMNDFVVAVTDSIQSLRKAVRILSLGLDYRRFSRFQLLAPDVNHLLRGDRKIRWGSKEEKISSSPTDLVFCIDFVIESALRLKEFDYESK